MIIDSIEAASAAVAYAGGIPGKLDIPVICIIVFATEALTAAITAIPSRLQAAARSTAARYESTRVTTTPVIAPGASVNPLTKITPATRTVRKTGIVKSPHKLYEGIFCFSML
jgi:hypothetical protein